MATVTVEVEKCSIEGCNKPATAKGYCASHYRRFCQYGDPLHTKRQFHGIPTKVVGISIPLALVEAAQAECEEGEKAVTKLAKMLVESKWGKEVLAAADIDLSAVGSVIVPRAKSEAEAKPKKARKKKAAAEAA
jgi:hypothetical protein